MFLCQPVLRKVMQSTYWMWCVHPHYTLQTTLKTIHSPHYAKVTPVFQLAQHQIKYSEINSLCPRNQLSFDLIKCACILLAVCQHLLVIISFHHTFGSLYPLPGSSQLASRGTVRSSRGSLSPTSLSYGRTYRTGNELDVSSPLEVEVLRVFYISFIQTTFAPAFPLCVLQCAKSSDALPCEPCEGQSAERASWAAI